MQATCGPSCVGTSGLGTGCSVLEHLLQHDVAMERSFMLYKGTNRSRA